MAQGVAFWIAALLRPPCHDGAVYVHVHVALAVSLVAMSAQASPQDWSTYKAKQGVTYEKRAVAGSRFFEYHAHTVVAMGPTALSDLIWAAIVNHTPPTVQKRVIVSRSDQEIVVYDQIHVPVIRDRDVAIRIHKNVAGTTATIDFQTANELAPPESKAYVRLPVVRGGWRLTPSGSGTLLEYSCYSEPGGSVPAFLARGVQDDELIQDVERILTLLNGSN